MHDTFELLIKIKCFHDTRNNKTMHSGNLLFLSGKSKFHPFKIFLKSK